MIREIDVEGFRSVRSVRMAEDGGMESVLWSGTRKRSASSRFS